MASSSCWFPLTTARPQGAKFNRRKPRLAVWAKQTGYKLGKTKGDDSEGKQTEKSPDSSPFRFDFGKLPDIKSLIPVVTNPSTGLVFGNNRRKDPGTVFVAGATGQAGIRIAQTLLQRGFSVRAGVPDLGAAQDLARVAATYKLVKDSKLYGDFSRKIKVVDYAPLIKSLSQRRLPDLAHQTYIQMKSDNLLPNYRTLSALMLCFAENGSVLRARTIWEEILNSSFAPDLFVISKLISAYEQLGCFSEVAKITKDIATRHSKLLPIVSSRAICCFGKNGQMQLMEDTIEVLDSKKISLDSTTANAIVRYYSSFGTLEKMEQAYGRLKKSGIVIEEKEIRAVLLAYLKQRKFYRLREFLLDVGLGRRNFGNILWNFVLLSYAADFKMKSLQREFIGMLDAGFSPDLTTFNIRALAFSRMALFWDLHLTVEHMRRFNIVPDLVTIGCVVDAYMDKRLARNLEFVYKRMNLDDSPVVLTDPLVFEVLGKGDFHLSSEAVLEFSQKKNWTYRKLIEVYLKKKLRRDQIFWNY